VVEVPWGGVVVVVAAAAAAEEEEEPPRRRRRRSCRRPWPFLAAAASLQVGNLLRFVRKA
jgi:hypothetical protein